MVAGMTLAERDALRASIPKVRQKDIGLRACGPGALLYLAMVGGLLYALSLSPENERSR